MNNLNRFTTLSFKNGKQLKNRVVVPPMASETGAKDGRVTVTTLAHYENLAKSKAGLVMVEYTYVHESGRSEENQLGLDHDDKIWGMKKIADIIHNQGSMAGVQLTHSGGKSTKELSSGFFMGPSAIAVPVKDQDMEVPQMMTTEDIQLWKDSFLASVERVVAAGFDLVELHAAHGYGLNQWLSPITNQRTDEYGGSLQNRTRLLLEIVSDIKKLFPDLLLAVRMPGQDFLEGGLVNEESQWIAKALEKSGVDIIDVSSGIGGWKRPRDRRGQGYLVDEAIKIQSVVNVPVIGVGGIESAQYIDQIIGEEKISLTAVGRAILAAPKQWGEINL